MQQEKCVHITDDNAAQHLASKSCLSLSKEEECVHTTDETHHLETKPCLFLPKEMSGTPSDTSLQDIFNFLDQEPMETSEEVMFDEGNQQPCVHQGSKHNSNVSKTQTPNINSMKRKYENVEEFSKVPSNARQCQQTIPSIKETLQPHTVNSTRQCYKNLVQMPTNTVQQISNIKVPSEPRIIQNIIQVSCQPKNIVQNCVQGPSQQPIDQQVPTNMIPVQKYSMMYQHPTTITPQQVPQQTMNSIQNCVHMPSQQPTDHNNLQVPTNMIPVQKYSMMYQHPTTITPQQVPQQTMNSIQNCVHMPSQQPTDHNTLQVPTNMIPVQKYSMMYQHPTTITPQQVPQQTMNSIQNCVHMPLSHNILQEPSQPPNIFQVHYQQPTNTVPIQQYPNMQVPYQQPIHNMLQVPYHQYFTNSTVPFQQYSNNFQVPNEDHTIPIQMYSNMQVSYQQPTNTVPIQMYSNTQVPYQQPTNTVPIQIYSNTQVPYQQPTNTVPIQMYSNTQVPYQQPTNTVPIQMYSNTQVPYQQPTNTVPIQMYSNTQVPYQQPTNTVPIQMYSNTQVPYQQPTNTFQNYIQMPKQQFTFTNQRPVLVPFQPNAPSIQGMNGVPILNYQQPTLNSMNGAGLMSKNQQLFVVHNSEPQYLTFPNEVCSPKLTVVNPETPQNMTTENEHNSGPEIPTYQHSTVGNEQSAPELLEVNPETPQNEHNSGPEIPTSQHSTVGNEQSAPELLEVNPETPQNEHNSGPEIPTSQHSTVGNEQSAPELSEVNPETPQNEHNSGPGTPTYQHSTVGNEQCAPELSEVNTETPHNTFICIICTDKFKAETDLEQHIKSHVNVAFRTCSSCGYESTNIEDYYNHCSDCKQTDMDFSEKDTVAWTSETVACKRYKCPGKYVSPCLQQIHINHQHFKSYALHPSAVFAKIYICPLCKVKFYDLKLFYAHCVPFSILSYCCTLCKLIFKDSTDLAKHSLEKHNIDKCYKCHICSVELDSKSSLDHHVKYDHNIHMLYCFVCASNIFLDSGTVYHFKHCLTNRKSTDVLICPLCGLKCDDLDVFLNHLHSEIEDNTKKYQCKFCLNHFCSKLNLSLHMINSQCQICGLLFKGRDKLIEHVEKEHKES